MRQIELNDYPNEEFLHLDWHTSGALANGQGAARAGYYGVSGVPHVRFDGYDQVVGAGDSLSAYNQYRTRITNHLNDPAYAQFLIDAEVNFSPSGGAITVDVEVAPGETISNPGDVRIRAAVYENDIELCCEPNTGNDHWKYIARLMIFQDVLTVSTSGEIQSLQQNFAVDPSWDATNLNVVVWVQRETTKRVLQGGKALKPYGVSVSNLDALVTSTQGTPAEFDTEVTYTGSTDDDVTVTLDKTALPAGWDAELQWGVVTNPNAITIPGMTQGQMEAITVRTIPNQTPGIGTVTATTAPVGNPGLGVSSDYSLFSNTPAILYVDDDNGEDYGPLFEDALTGAGYSFLSREIAVDGDPDAVDLFGYDAVVWGTGWANFNTIPEASQEALQAYLDAGGNCFVSSQGVLAHLGINVFTETYLGVTGSSNFVGAPSVTGVAGDPIGDGLSFAMTPPFSDLADVITSGTGTIWLNGANGDVGIRNDAGSFRTVLMSASFEGVPGAESSTVMQRIIDWLLAGGGASDVAPAESVSDLSLALWQNTPNPFATTTRVRFAVPREGAVRLDVFDVTGRRVVNLVDRVLATGEHSVVWGGADAAGRRVASGVYLYRLQAAGRTVSKEMVLTR